MKTTTSIIFLFFFILGTGFSQEEYGKASYYADEYHGGLTASGEAYDKTKLSGAHKTLPFGTMVRVTRLDNKKSVVVRINDRGPFIPGRVVDVSRKAAEKLDLITAGYANVKLEVVGKEVASREEPKKEEPKNTFPSITKPKEYTAKSGSAAAEKPIVKKALPKIITSQPAEKVSTPSAPAKPTKVSTPKATASSAEKTSYKMVKSQDFKEYDLYKIQLLRPEKTGYGVQVASFTQYENVLRQIAMLQDKWFKNILVSVEKGKDEKPLYKIFLGPFPDHPTATSYKGHLKEKGMEGFVVNMENINFE